MRSALWIARLWSGLAGIPVPADTAALVLKEVAPGAQIWAWEPARAATLVTHASLRAEGADPRPTEGPDEAGARDAGLRAGDYMDRVIEGQRAPGVQSTLLLGALRRASSDGRRRLATDYYRRILSEFPDTREARLAAALDPERRLWVGDPAPDVPLPALDSTAPAFTRADLAGPATLVDFWAVSCTPCVAEIPRLRAVYRRFANRGFRIVSVSLDPSRETVRRFRKTHAMPWAQAFAGEGPGARGPIAGAYNVNVIPDHVLIGPDGNILALNAELHGEGLERTLERLLPGEDGGGEDTGSNRLP